MDLEGKSFRMSWNVSITVTNSAIGKPGEGQTTVFARESCPPHHFKAIIHWIEQFLNEPEEAKKSMPPKIVDAFRENVISGKTTYPFSYTFTINLVKSAVFKQTSLVLVSAQFGSLLSSCCNLQIVIKELDELRSLGTLCVDSVTVGVNNNKKPKNKKLLEKFLKLQRPRRLAIVVDNKVCPTRIIPYIIEPLRDPENEWVQHYSYISLDMGPVVVSNYENRIRAYCEFLTIFSSVLFKFDKIEVIDYCLESHLATVPSNPPPPNALKELSNLEVSNGTILAIRDLFLHLQLSFDHLGLVTLPDSFALLSVMQHWFDATFQKNAQSWADHIAFRKPDPNAYTREAPLVGLYVWYIFTSILNQVWNKRHDDATIEFITTKLNMNFDEVVLPVTVLQKGTHSLRSIIQIFTRYKQNIFVRLLNGYRMNRKSFFHQE